MNSKTLKRELIVAVVMVLVAAIALSGSTYAWFTMNSVAKATGMKMKVTSGSNLLIAHTTDSAEVHDNDYKTTEALNYETSELLAPASTVDTSEFYTTTAAAVNNYAKDAAAVYDLTEEDYIFEQFWLKSGVKATLYLSQLKVADKDGDVKVGYNTTTNVPWFWNCFRMAVVDHATIGSEDGISYKIYALSTKSCDGSAQDGTNTTGRGVYKDSEDEDTIKVNTAMTLVCVADTGALGTTTVNTTESVTNPLGTLEADTGKLYDVYFWFEGEDGACYTNNINPNDLTIEIGFSAKTIIEE